MAVKYMNSFIQAAQDIFGQIAPDIVFERKDTCEKQSPFVADSVVSIVGFNGDVGGQVAFAFKQEFALQVAGIMCGMELNQMDELALSAIGELSNMISGRVVINLDELDNEKTNITPPAILFTKEKISVSLQQPIVCVPYYFKNELVFEINYSLK